MMNNYPENDYRNYLEHHGVLGMHWGVRRYQNSDGTLTAAGKKRYSASSSQRGDIESEESMSQSKFSAEMKKIGWKEDKEFAKMYGFGMYFTKNVELNGSKVLLTTDFDEGAKLSGNIPKQLASFEKDLPNADKVMRNAIADDMYERRWDENPSITRSKFKNGIKLQHFRCMCDDDDVYGEASYDDGGYFYGHVISVEYSHKQKKAYYPSLQG